MKLAKNNILLPATSASSGRVYFPELKTLLAQDGRVMVLLQKNIDINVSTIHKDKDILIWNNYLVGWNKFVEFYYSSLWNNGYIPNYEFE